MSNLNNTTTLILNRVRKYTETLPLPIMVGFSGGADSTVLAHSMLQVLGKDNVICIHINHMLRGEDANKDEEHCKEFCKQYGIKFIYARVNVNEIAKGKAIEETARNVRYQIFDDMMKKNNCKFIALAHTKSDNMETIIFNLVRGTGSSGLKGIPNIRDIGTTTHLIRPLIEFSRDDILAYCEENNLSYVTDETNFDTQYSRNYIRQNIVPLLKKLNPSVEDAFYKMSNLISVDSEFIDTISNNFVRDNMTNEGISVEKLNNLHYAVATRVIRNYAWHPLSEANVLSILMLCKQNKEENAICLPYGMTACIRNGNLFIYQNNKSPEKVERYIFSYQLPKANFVFREGFATSINLPNPPENHTLVGYIKLDKEDLDHMIVRSYVASDKYFFYKMTRNIKKTASTLDKEIRIKRPVFELNGEVIWYPGFPIREDYKAKDGDITLYYFEKNS